MFTEDEKRILLYSLIESRLNSEEYISNHKNDLEYLKDVDAADKFIEYHQTEIEEAMREIEEIDKLYKKVSSMEITRSG